MNKLDKNILLTVAILGALTIALGAFGAHGLKEMVSATALDSFNTGIRYQMYHVLALLVLGFVPANYKDTPSTQPLLSASTKRWVFIFFLLGIFLFSGSIYFLSTQELHGLSVSILGPITPIGGLALMLGWLRLGYGILKLNK
ncbi:MAG: DUF423 domain-containing protein [Flavobacteriaceae bacterium]|nr:DUF423 domain-containing protein [Flavobacteriaceae bacterium]